MLNGILLTDKNCSNKHIQNVIQKSKTVVQRGKFFCRSSIMDTDWKKAWLLLHMYCISNKAKEVHFKVLHNIYPFNSLISKFVDIGSSCTFCSQDVETVPHLFFTCDASQKFWPDLEASFFNLVNSVYSLNLI